MNQEYCPVCQSPAVASGLTFETGRAVDNGDRWCLTDDCPHNADTGTPWHVDVTDD